ncbi:MAG: response regulator [Elusimicrobia bacterium CG08_land_8_20_14_0_20_59_10]|nr:MAG: response regulator [Elusimicrobia bacterium CG08_land_8_20_14_0_20_59_10]
MKILVADDDKIFLALMVNILADSGYEVIEAENGVEAWEKLQAEGADLAILDIEMPEMDGRELLKLMMSDDRFKNIPVLVLTVGFMAEDIVGLYTESTLDYITKPFDSEDLVTKVQELQNRLPK